MDKVQAALKDTKLIAWDGSHDIWLALDDAQAVSFVETPELQVYRGSGMMDMVQLWWQQSSAERFIHGLRSQGSWEGDKYINRVVQLVPRVYGAQPPMDKFKLPMYRCSLCTQAFCSEPTDKKCSQCQDGVPAVCDRCVPVGLVPDTCSLCTQRAHVCLSKCSGGCIKKQKVEMPTCQCSNGPRRLQVQKEGPNHHRWFFSCRNCDFFKWE